MENKIERIVIVDPKDGSEHVFTGGGGTPGADSVGSDEIRDESIEERDLSAAVRAKLDALDGATEITEDEIDDIVAQACASVGLEVPKETNE